jgi:ABC-type dipeptide/oligopeptide/nickel transport system permease subunit
VTTVLVALVTAVGGYLVGVRRTTAEEKPLLVPKGPRSRGYWESSARRLLRQRATVVALAVLAALLVIGAFPGTFANTGWNDIHLDDNSWINSGPTLTHGWARLLGTDHIGRSTVQRIVWGLHDSETTAVEGALLAALIGLVLGSLAALYGGVVDTAIMRVADFATTFPVLITMIAAFVLLQPISLRKATLIFAFYLWGFVARVVRARIRALLPEEFVDAARALGAAELRILVRHLWPNALGAVIIVTTSLIGQIMLVEATAEYFGFGINSLVRPTLGNLIADNTQGGIQRFNQLGLGWWTWVGPAGVLVAVLVCLNLLGDGLERALDPRSSR